MSMQIYNGGIFGGILKIIKESDERDGTSSLSQEDLEYMDYLETLPKNVPAACRSVAIESTNVSL